MYMDRWGNMKSPSPSDVVKDRQGAFAIIVSNEQMLVTAGPHAPDIPELPGGGIDEGENAEQAVIREIYEETAQSLSVYKIKEKWSFDVDFYADDVNEYWNYTKQYFEIILENNDHFFEAKIETPEGGYAWWMPIQDIQKPPSVQRM